MTLASLGDLRNVDLSAFSAQPRHGWTGTSAQAPVLGTATDMWTGNTTSSGSPSWDISGGRIEEDGWVRLEDWKDGGANWIGGGFRPLDGSTFGVHKAQKSKTPPSVGSDMDRTVFVGGLPKGVTVGSVKTFFEEYGLVQFVQLKHEKDTGEFRGFGFVTFVEKAAAEAACKKKVLKYEGKNVSVRPSASGKDDDLGTMFVGGLPQEATPEQVQRHFEQYGPVGSVDLKYDYDGKFRGFAFVIFENKETANMVYANYDKNTYEGKWINCRPSVRRNPGAGELEANIQAMITGGALASASIPITPFTGLTRATGGNLLMHGINPLTGTSLNGAPTSSGIVVAGGSHGLSGVNDVAGVAGLSPELCVAGAGVGGVSGSGALGVFPCASARAGTTGVGGDVDSPSRYGAVSSMIGDGFAGTGALGAVGNHGTTAAPGEVAVGDIVGGSTANSADGSLSVGEVAVGGIVGSTATSSAIVGGRSPLRMPSRNGESFSALHGTMGAAPGSAAIGINVAAASLTPNLEEPAGNGLRNGMSSFVRAALRGDYGPSVAASIAAASAQVRANPL